MSLATKIAKLTRFAHKPATNPPPPESHKSSSATVAKPSVSKHKAPATKHWPVNEIARAGGYEIQFQCRSDLEVMRAQTLATKEVGTVDWILNDLKSGQTFFDIGANIGVAGSFEDLLLCAE